MRQPIDETPSIAHAARVDVFVGPGGSGNEAAVLFDPEGRVSEAELLPIARAMRAPATVFIASREEPHRVRFFTQSIELPFCGHGSLAAGAVLARVFGRDHFRLQTPGGLLVSLTTDTPSFVTVQLPLRGRFVGSFDRDGVLSALRLHPSQIAHDLPFVVAPENSPKCLVPLRDPAALNAVSPDSSLLAEWSRVSAVNGVYVYVIADSARGARARAFNPRSGQPEDRATGVAAAALFRAVCNDDSPLWFRVRQGLESEATELQVRSLGDDHIELGGRVRLDTFGVFDRESLGD